MPPTQARSDVSSMADSFILIPGRTAQQGCGISEGKFQDKYLEEVSVLRMAREDMERLQLSDGDRVRLTSDSGHAEAPVVAARKDELPAGLLFIAYGELSSQLMGHDTHGTGMPTSKCLDVTLDVLKEE
jgi:formylmethanofuran dehydrogenase subunit D